MFQCHTRLWLESVNLDLHNLTSIDWLFLQEKKEAKIDWCTEIYQQKTRKKKQQTIEERGEPTAGHFFGVKSIQCVPRTTSRMNTSSGAPKKNANHLDIHSHGLTSLVLNFWAFIMEWRPESHYPVNMDGNRDHNW